jgi:hypothetical protein
MNEATKMRLFIGFSLRFRSCYHKCRLARRSQKEMKEMHGGGAVPEEEVALRGLNRHAAVDRYVAMSHAVPQTTPNSVADSG